MVRRTDLGCAGGVEPLVETALEEGERFAQEAADVRVGRLGARLSNRLNSVGGTCGA